MSLPTEEIMGFVQTLGDCLNPVRETVERLVGSDAKVESGAMLISHKPRVAPEAYACVLFHGVDSRMIDHYETLQIQSNRYFRIPPPYREVLTRLNGASLFNIELFGIPRSMLQNPPTLDRSVRQPLDLATANMDWRKQYDVGADRFYFGCVPHTSNRNVGYFLLSDGQVEAFVEDGTKVNSWPGMKECLSEEIARAEFHYQQFEHMMEEAQMEIASARKRQR